MDKHAMAGLPHPVPGQPRALPKHCRSALELAAQCRHGKMPAQCHECARCPHGKQRQECRDCNAASRRWCPHFKRKHDCKECSGCPHNRVKRCCKDCNGSAVCSHGRLRKNCRDCNQSSANPCPHGRSRNRCDECRAGMTGAALVVVGGPNVAHAPSTEHSVSMGMPHDPRLPPNAPDSVEGAGAGLGHEPLSALEDQHKQLSGDDASVLADPSHSAMQVLGVDQMSASSIQHEHMHFSPAHALKVHALSPSHVPKVPRSASQEHGIGSVGLVEAEVCAVDDGTSPLRPLRLCPHSKPRGECGECVKNLGLGLASPYTPVGLGHEVGTKRPLDEFSPAASAKTNEADVLKSPGAVGGSGSAADMLLQHAHMPPALLLHAHMPPAPSDGVICEHNRLRSHCDHCTACRHGKMKSKCKECAVCEAHGRLRHDCRECNSGSRR